MEEISLKDLFSLIWSKKIIILIIVGVSIIAGVIYSYFFKKVEYTASASLILVQSSTIESQPGGESITTTDLNINSSLLSTYSELIRRDAVLSEVAYNLKKPEELATVPDGVKVTVQGQQTITYGKEYFNDLGVFTDLFKLNENCEDSCTIKVSVDWDGEEGKAYLNSQEITID